jgi:hypothetical protein
LDASEGGDDDAAGAGPLGTGEVDRKGKGKATPTDEGSRPRADGWDDDGAVEERMASLDVLGVSALEGSVNTRGET